jgi:hypothetical protein
VDELAVFGEADDGFFLGLLGIPARATAAKDEVFLVRVSFDEGGLFLLDPLELSPRLSEAFRVGCGDGASALCL